MTKQLQSFFGAALGSTIEYYDYALFSIFLPIISPQFFPGQDAYHSLMSGYYILTITMLVRPFGGVIFGHIGDFIGRPRALLLSMYGIAITTFIIGITPNRGSSLGFTTGMSLLGGMTPLVENMLYSATGKFSSAAIWLIFIGLGSLWSFARAQPREDRQIAEPINAQQFAGSE